MLNIELGVIGLGPVIAERATRQIAEVDLVAVADSHSEVTEAFITQVGGVIVAAPINPRYQVVTATSQMSQYPFYKKPTVPTCALREMITARREDRIVYVSEVQS